MSKAKNAVDKIVDAIKHDEATRRNIPTAEYQSMVQEDEESYIKVAYERRNKDLDPQLVWRGKDVTDWSDLVVQAPPLYIQEKVHPKALIDELMRQSKEQDYASGKIMADLFADFNGLPKDADKTEFYQHDQHWSNRMILGDSLQVMASLTEREGLRGKVQCIYLDPPYGIKFNSNFQWSTTSRDVKDGKIDNITREPEQVKAFRDTWKDGIHSYLSYLRDRLTVARDLLKDSGSIFVQIGDENVHRVRVVMDEVFGEENFVSQIIYSTTSTQGSNLLPVVNDNILWYAKTIKSVKYRQLFARKIFGEFGTTGYNFLQRQDGSVISVSEVIDLREELKLHSKIYASSDLTSSHYSKSEKIIFQGVEFGPKTRYWSTSTIGMYRLANSDRIIKIGSTLRFKRFLEDFDVLPLNNLWSEQFSEQNKNYVVQTASGIIQRCIIMSTDPGDLVLDPTCGSGTTAFVAEQWGRRWITIDTSRVALALARSRIMGARYAFYLLADSKEGQQKESEITQTFPSSQPVNNNIRQGFVYERVPHITLKSIANNVEIDVIWDKWQHILESLREQLNSAVKQKWEEWEIPREGEEKWTNKAKALHSQWWQARIARQNEINASIAAKAEYEYLYDKAYDDKKKVRVAGPFTVESISPHRALIVGENDELIDPNKQNSGGDYRSFAEMIIQNLKTSGVQQAHKDDKINFTSLVPWPGSLICADGRYMEGDKEKKAAIFIGPEFGTVQRIDLVEAAREAADANFDVLISCAFSYEAHTTEFSKLGRINVLKARMNADLHMADDLKNTGKGNLFVIFGEPDIEVLNASENKIQIKINGVDVFHPTTGEVRSDGAEGIACWFIDTDYNEESFFVRHAYFLGANDPYGSLKNSLKAEINQEAWESLHSDTSRAFPKPKSGRIAVKVINHLGDEVMKVFKIV